MSSVIDEFLTLDNDNETPQTSTYESVWQKMQKQIDKFDEYRIHKALNCQIERNQDLVIEMSSLIQIWQQSIHPNRAISNETHIDPNLLEIPERQLLQKQILLSLKEIKRSAAKKKISVRLVLPFNKNSVHYKTLMYIIKKSQNVSDSSKHAHHTLQQRPSTSINVNPSKMLQNDMNLSWAYPDQDLIEQTRCALNDEYQILLHRVQQLRMKLDCVYQEIKEQTFIPSTNDMHELSDRLQTICNELTAAKTNVSSNKTMKKKIKLKPLNLPPRISTNNYTFPSRQRRSQPKH